MKHILSGKATSRAIQRHLMVHAALCTMLTANAYNLTLLTNGEYNRDYPLWMLESYTIRSWLMSMLLPFSLFKDLLPASHHLGAEEHRLFSCVTFKHRTHNASIGPLYLTGTRPSVDHPCWLAI